MSVLATSQQTRAQVVNGFLRSNEGLGRVIDAFYMSYLEHYADAPSRSAWINALNGGTTFGSVATAILASPEFFANAGSNL